MIHAIRDADCLNEDKETIVLFYTDAPPHHDCTGGGNWQREKGSFKPGATDWVTISFTAKARHMRVFTFIPSSLGENAMRFYAFLSEVTGGLCMTTNSDSQTQEE